MNNRLYIYTEHNIIRTLNLLEKCAVKFYDVRTFIASHDDVKIHQQLLLFTFVYS